MIVLLGVHFYTDTWTVKYIKKIHVKAFPQSYGEKYYAEKLILL